MRIQHEPLRRHAGPRGQNARRSALPRILGADQAAGPGQGAESTQAMIMFNQLKKRNTKALRKWLRRRGDIHADAKVRGWNAIHRFIARGIK